jgi:hypothetical protein
MCAENLFALKNPMASARFDKNYDDFKQKVNLSLSSISQWFDASQLVLNMRKTIIVKFPPINSSHSHSIQYTTIIIEVAAGTKFWVCILIIT